ncbi:MAG: hypothetical protein C7B43_20840 [Sulfobacillus benefaciens]|jgi:CRISPR-associated endoribonuclease Cas6|uniref:CRISPR associated protein Cas6 C-terminal domain-containing protein n=1 Tax=Sulfobacillus benefaciens TaxID=453960 RepID=A0A2T2WJ75_9FIRM|nr:MAG: hypothetical protein C7B43_20840 [Sulfobacillus benefaciens]
MQLTFYLRATTPPARIPWAYPAMITAWLYGLIQHTPVDPMPHRAHSGVIRPFATTPLLFLDPFISTAWGIQPTSPWATILVKAMDASLLSVMAKQAVSRPLRFGAQSFLVESSFLSDPDWPTPWTTRLLSPIVVADRLSPTSSGSCSKVFMDPDHPRFLPLLKQNLAKKVRQFSGTPVAEDAFQITLPRRWRRKFWTLYGHPVIGWFSDDPMTIAGPSSIIAAAATFGLGVSNTHGFGALDTVDERSGDDAQDGGNAFWI